MGLYFCLCLSIMLIFRVNLKIGVEKYRKNYFDFAIPPLLIYVCIYVGVYKISYIQVLWSIGVRMVINKWLTKKSLHLYLRLFLLNCCFPSHRKHFCSLHNSWNQLLFQSERSAADTSYASTSFSNDYNQMLKTMKVSQFKNEKQF